MPDVADLVARLRGDPSDLNQALSKAQTDLEKTAVVADKAAVNIHKAFQGAASNIKQLNFLPEGLAEGFGKITSFATGPAGVAAGIGAALLGIGKAATDVATDWAKAKRALGEEGWKPADIEAAKDSITRLRGSTAGLNADMPTIARALDDVGDRLNLSGAAAEKVTGQFLNFGRIAGGDVTSNIAGVSKVLQSWNIDASQSGLVMDKLVVAQQNWGVSTQATEAALTRYGPILRNMGFGLDTSIALFGQFEKAGLNQQAMMSGLQKATALFAKEHIGAEKGLNQTITAIKNARTETDAAAIAFKTFGPKAGQSFVDAIRSGKLSLDDMTASLGDAAGATDRAVQASLTGGEKWGMAMEKLKLRLLPVGEVLLNIGSKITNVAIAGLDMVGGAMDKLGGVVQRVRDAWGDTAGQNAGSRVAGILGALGLSEDTAATIGRLVNGPIEAIQGAIARVRTVVQSGIQQMRDAWGDTAGQSAGARAAGILGALGLGEDTAATIGRAINGTITTIQGALTRLRTAFTMGMGAWQAGNFGAGAATFLDFLGFPSDVGTAVQAWVTVAETAIGGAKARLQAAIATLRGGAGGEDERGRGVGVGAKALSMLGLSMTDAAIIDQWGQTIRTALGTALGQIGDVVNRLRDDWKKDPLVNYVFKNWGGSESQVGMGQAQTAVQKLDAAFKTVGLTIGPLKKNWDDNAKSLNDLAVTIHTAVVGAVADLTKALDNQIKTARDINASIRDLVTSIGNIATTIRGGVISAIGEIGTALGKIQIPDFLQRKSPSPLEQTFMGLNTLIPQTTRHMGTLQGAMGNLSGGGKTNIADLFRNNYGSGFSNADIEHDARQDYAELFGKGGKLKYGQDTVKAYLDQVMAGGRNSASGILASAPSTAPGASNLPLQPIPVTIAPSARTSKGGNAAGTIIENMTITVTATYDARDMAQRIIAELGLMGIKINA